MTITIEEVRNMLLTNPKAVARALVVLTERQTYDERVSETTKHHNLRGFRPCHAKMGTSMAGQFQRKGTLSWKQIWYWWAKQKDGKARIEIYAAQIHKAMLEKAATKVTQVAAPAGNDDIPDPTDPETDAEFNSRWVGYKNAYARQEARQEQMSFQWQMNNH